MKRIKMRNRILSLILTICVFAGTFLAFPINASAATADEHTVNATEISNEYMKATIQSDRFKLYTTGGDPDSDTDNNKKLLYDCTSHTIIRIGSSDYCFTPEGNIKRTPDGKSLYAVDTINGVKVEQYMSFVYNTYTLRYDAVEYKYVFTNVSATDKTAGTRIFFDTMLGSNDSAPFIINGEQVTTMRTYTGDNIPQTWQVLDSFVSPSIIAVGTFYNDISERPDKVQFLRYSNGSHNGWDCTANGGTIGDSAVNVYFDPDTLAPGESRTVKTYYGISRVPAAPAPDDDGELILLATPILELIPNADNTAYLGNPFTYNGFVTNEDNITYNNVTATINLPEGLSADRTSISLGNISPDATQSFAIAITADNRDTAATLTYSVTITADNLDEAITSEYAINLPALRHEHNFVQTGYVDSTCTEYGNISYVCSCGETKTTYLPSKMHHYESTVTVAATCTTPGIMTHTCSWCGNSYTTYIYAEHVYSVAEYVPATCTENGYYRYECESCDSYYIEDIPGSHSYDATVTKAATAEEDGEITYTCSICGHTYVETIPARESASILLVQDRLPWTESVNTLLLSRLLSNGYITGWDQTTTANFASVDLSAYNVIFVANDQSTATYNQLARFNECITDFARAGGVVVYGACDHGWAGGNISYALPGGVIKGNYYSYRNYIVNNTHNVVTGVLTDGKSLTDALLYSTYSSHTYFTNLPEDTVTILADSNGRPTLVEYPLGDGYIIASGLTWEYTYVRDFVAGTSFAKCVYDDLLVHAALMSDPCEHEYGEGTVIDPTCTEDGYTLRTCTLCGATRRDDFTDALGHDFGEWVVVSDPTYVAAGLKEKNCSRCDAVIEEIIPMIDGPVIRVEAPTDTVILGQEITFILTIENLDPIKSMAVTPHFDSGIFEFVSATWLQDAFLQSIEAETLRSVSAWTESTDANGDMFAIVLRAKSLTDATSVNFTLLVQNGEEMYELPVIAETITVISCPHTSFSYETINNNVHACICDNCGYTEIANHNFADAWVSNDDSHWHECTLCGGQNDATSHIYDGVCDDTCNICEHVRMVANIFVSVDSYENIKSGSIEITFDNDAIEIVSGEWLIPGAFMTDFNSANARGVFAFTDPALISGNIFNLSVKGIDPARWALALAEMSITVTLVDEIGTETGIVLSSEDINISLLYCHDFSAHVATDEYFKEGATCTVAAVYYVSCSVCGEKGEDTFTYGDTLPHTYSEVWTIDESGHWHECTICGHDDVKAAHEYDNACDADCNVCGNGRIPPHDFDIVWSNDDDNHWHECTLCDAISDLEAHEFSGDTRCDICEYHRYLLGDADNDDDVDSDDAIYLLYHIFFFEDTGEYPVVQRCDFNGDYEVDSDDAIYLLYHIFFFEDTGEYPLYDMPIVLD